MNVYMWTGYRSDSITLVHTSKLGGPTSIVQHTAAQVFTYKQLQMATHNFNEGNVIGRGGFGSVYKGILSDGKMAAIKQLDRSSKQGDLEFRVEVSRITNFSFLLLFYLRVWNFVLSFLFKFFCVGNETTCDILFSFCELTIGGHA